MEIATNGRIASSMSRRVGIVTCTIALTLLTACRPRTGLELPPSPAALHFPGVDVIRASNGGTIIRVFSGLVGSNPLYVVDGTPMTIDPRRGLDWLSPDQIVRVEVLKTPAETAIYGPPGAHGVIVVTTRGALKH